MAKQVVSKTINLGSSPSHPAIEVEEAQTIGLITYIAFVDQEYLDKLIM